MPGLDDIQKKILNTSFWMRNIPVGFQLGLPMLCVKRGRLLLSFFVYRTESQKNSLILFPPGYFMSFLYPFDKLVHYLDLRYTKSSFITAEPVRLLLSDRVIEIYNNLYLNCESAIREWETGKDEERIRQYQELFDKTVVRLNLEAIYNRGKINDLCWDL